MVDSITDSDLNRMEKAINMDNCKDRAGYEREFQKAFGTNFVLKEHLWTKRLWQKTLQQYGTPGIARRWTADEEAFLKRYPNARTNWVARHFPTPRSYKSIWSKRQRLKYT